VAGGGTDRADRISTKAVEKPVENLAFKDAKV
jgi:hypothetical protein